MLSKKEWIAVAVALVVVILFLGARFLSQPTSQTMDQNSLTDQNANSNIATGITIATTTNPNNTMNQNTNSSSNAGGLIVKDTLIGTGAEAKAGNLVSVQYTGSFADGKVFDSSIPRGQPLQFVLGAGQVIPGWDQGILGMKVGGKRTLIIPPALGYGAAGFPPVIPANATLYFDVELTAVQVQ